MLLSTPVRAKQGFSSGASSTSAEDGAAEIAGTGLTGECANSATTAGSSTRVAAEGATEPDGFRLATAEPTNLTALGTLETETLVETAGGTMEMTDDPTEAALVRTESLIAVTPAPGAEGKEEGTVTPHREVKSHAKRGQRRVQ